MIRKQRQLFYFVGETPYASLEQAQHADLVAMMPVSSEMATREGVADWLLKESSAIVDTLMITNRSRLEARKLHGATRKPRSKKESKPADPNKPF